MITDISSKKAFKQTRPLDKLKNTSKNTHLTDVKITETDTQYHYELKIPGYIKEDFRFYVSGNNLVVTTAKKEDKKQISLLQNQKHSYCYPSALFKREFPIPKDAIRTKITTNYVNEILSFNLFKSKS